MDRLSTAVCLAKSELETNKLRDQHRPQALRKIDTGSLHFRLWVSRFNDLEVVQDAHNRKLVLTESAIYNHANAHYVWRDEFDFKILQKVDETFACGSTR